MAIPTNKKELQTVIETNHSKLDNELLTISIEKAEEPSLEGHSKGTQMRVCNLIAYLIG